MSGIKVLVILSVTAFDLAVMTGSERLDKLVGDMTVAERALKERHIAGLRAAESLRKLKTGVCLYTFYFNSEALEMFDHMKKKLHGRINQQKSDWVLINSLVCSIIALQKEDKLCVSRKRRKV